MIKKFLKKIKNSFKIFKNDCIYSWKSTFYISWEFRKKIIYKRLLMLPFVIILTYLTVSYLDFVILKMSYETYFADYWLTIPDWIDFSVEETEYEQAAHDFSVILVCGGCGFIVYYCVTIFCYELQILVNQFTLFFLLATFFWFYTRDTETYLVFHIIYYMGSIICWGNYFFNWFFYWGWNYYQWAIDLEEEIDEDEEWEDRAHEVAVDGNINKNSWLNYFWKKSSYEHLLKKEIKDNSNAQRIYIKSVFTAWWDVFIHFYFETMRSFDVQGARTPAQIADKIYGTTPAQVEDRYRKHLYQYHWDALFFDELRDRMDDMTLKDIKHEHREDYTDPNDLYIHEDELRTREYEDMEKWRLFNLYSYYGPLSDILYYHLTEFRPWFTRPNVIGKYALFTRRYVTIIYNNIIYQYYVLNNGNSMLKRFYIRFTDNFPIKKIFNLSFILKSWINKKLMIWFYFRKSWKIRRAVRRLNSKADRKKKIEDPFFYKTKEINPKN